MLRFFSIATKKMEIPSLNHGVDSGGVWFDLYNPSLEEVRWVERELHLSLPTTEEMEEIEYSSRLYQEEGASYITMNLITSVDSDQPLSSPVTFVLTDKYLVTVRYIDPKAFYTFALKAQKNFHEGANPDLLFLTLLELIVDRVADIIEVIGREIDMISQEIFTSKKGIDSQRALKDVVVHLGQQGDLSTKVRLSLEQLNRSLKFINGQIFSSEERAQYGERLAILGQDVLSITDHVSFIFHKINFLLDATLGVINIEQNAVVKILSGAAVIFLPPTLIASIYGMNFASMPELHHKWAYPVILIVMLLSSVLPYYYFKRKGWLH